MKYRDAGCAKYRPLTLAVGYIANIAPYVSIADSDCETANAGWRRFLLLNYVTGFLITQLLLWTTLGR